MNREYRESLSYSLEKKFIRLEERIMRDVIRRLKKTGEITSSADWQLLRYHLLGNGTADIEKEIKKCLDGSYPLVFEAYDKALEKEYVRYAPLYEQINEKIISFDDNKELHQLIDALQKQSNQELFNITKSLGFAIPDPVTKKVLFTPLLDFYNGVLDDAMLDIASGAFDYESTIRKAVKQMVNSGLRTVAYGSGWSNRVDVAARRAVMTGISQLTGQISFMNAEKLGTDYYEVAWHSGARPTHAVWQGKVWSSSQLVSVCGYGTVTGLCGANCYHEFYPFIPGISERNWSDEWLEKQNKKENSPKEYGDKSYTEYEARQQQRKMETAMRAQREKVSLLKEAGVNEDDVLNAQIKYNNQLYEYARFSNKMGLKQQRQRIYSDMRGRILPRDDSVVKYQKIRYNKSGNIIVTDDWSDKEHVKIPAKYRQNAVIETIEKKKGITYRNRTIYDKNGRMVKQVHSGNHGNPKTHNYGKNGEHVHVYEWQDGKIKRRYTRDIEDGERKEYGDLL